MVALEKAILISFDQSGTIDSVLKSQAIEYCQRIKESPMICSICVERLFTSKLEHVQFWCLQCLHDVVCVRYSSMGIEEKQFLRKSVFAMACYEGVDDKNLTAVYIKNKLAQVLVTLIYFEYPLIWSSVFVDFLSHLRKGAVVIDMFCRVLNALDDELISLDYPCNAEEMAVAGRIKDAMRQQCVPQIVKAWYGIVNLYKSSDFELCASVLDSMRRYISWVDINLILNCEFIPLLFELILVEGLPEQLRGAAASCVLAVVLKRMDPQAKLSLLKSLQINRAFSLINQGADSELVSSIATLLNGYAAEVLECVKRLTSEDGKLASMQLVEEVLPSVFYVIQNCEVDAAFSIVQFLSGYVATMKNVSQLTEKQRVHVVQILEVIRAQICYDPVYRNHLDVLDKIGSEEEDRMQEHRKDLLVLLRSVGHVAPDVTQIFIHDSLVSAVAASSERNVEEVEAALMLLYSLGESINDDAMRSGSGLLELVHMILSSKFPCHSSRLVALTYLETITRYMKYIQEYKQFIPAALPAFLDERGIHHPNLKVRRRASYLFMRVVKQLKSKLVFYIETILQSLQDIVAQFTNMGFPAKGMTGSEDGSYIFEAIGILIGMEDVPLEKQTDYLSSLLMPLCQQVKTLLVNANMQNSEESSANIAIIQQIIMAINALSKGFSERLVTASRPAIGLMFKQFFNWMQNKLHGRSGNQKSDTVPLHYHSKQPPQREEFSDWPQGLLTIGTFGNNDLRDKAIHSEIQTVTDEQEQNPTSASSPDLSEFTPEEVGKLQKELTKLLKRKPAKQEEENPDLPLDRFLNCPSSLEVSRRISNAVCTDPAYKEDDIERTISAIIGKCKEVRAEKSKNAIGKKSLSFLLKKMFVCANGFSPAPSLRDTLQESRMEKLLRTILRKKIYPQSSSRTSSMKRYIEDKHISNKRDHEEEKEEKPRAKWDKTDSEYIVLEI